MSKTFTYKIISVDETARCMEVIYSSDKDPIMHISTRLPYEGETLETIIQMYAPVQYWEEQKMNVVSVLAGTSGNITVQVPLLPTPKEAAVIRRNIQLAASDWTQLPDVTLSIESLAAWVLYRQQLRDITNQPGFPENIVWPVAPDNTFSGTLPATTL